MNLQLKLGNGEHIIPRNGWWNIKDKVIDITYDAFVFLSCYKCFYVVQKFLEPKKLENWVLVNFSTSCDVRKMFEELPKISSAKGMVRLFYDSLKK